MTNESIIQIIQKAQRSEERPANTNQKYVSLAAKEEPEVIEKNIIVDDADFELQNCLEEDEDWMFQTFNRKKMLEQQAEESIEEPPVNHRKPPQPVSRPQISESEQPKKQSHHRRCESSTNIDPEADKPKRRKKTSKHRRTESTTFDKDFLQTLANSCPN